MVRVEPTFNKAGQDKFFGRFCTGRFWHTVRDAEGIAVYFDTEGEAQDSARQAWVNHSFPNSRSLRAAL